MGAILSLSAPHPLGFSQLPSLPKKNVSLRGLKGVEYVHRFVTEPYHVAQAGPQFPIPFAPASQVLGLWAGSTMPNYQV